MARRGNLLLLALAGLAGFWAVSAFAKNDTINPDTLPDDEPLPGVDLGLVTNLLDDLMPATNWKVNEYPKYASFISQTEQRNGMPANLLGRTLYQESRYRPDIINGTKRSPVGALGIAQFMPQTARDYGLTVDDKTDDRLDPIKSIDAAGRYLKALYNQFSGNWQYALMAYNWGPGNVAHYLNGDINPRTGRAYTLPGETSDYIAAVTQDIPAIA